MMSRLFAAFVVVALCASPLRAAGPLEFHLSFDRATHAKPFSGRAYVMLFRNSPRELAAGPNWFRPEPFFAREWRERVPRNLV